MNESLDSPSANTPRQRCMFDHAAFNRLGDISFGRSASDGSPVVILPYGDSHAVLPLPSLQKELGIADDSADGRMLVLIRESLGFVTAIRVGDDLPAEVVSGEASWTPRSSHLRSAQLRLRLALLAWHDQEAAQRAARGIERLGRLEVDPELKTALQNASRKAMTLLGFKTPDEVMHQVDVLAKEFAFIEALRENLLLPVSALITRARRLAASVSQVDAIRLDAIGGITKMGGIALADIQSHFAKPDAVSDNIIDLLQEPDLRVAFIQEARDALYRRQVGWTPILDRWATMADDNELLLWQLVADTCQFLARRYLPAKEWRAFDVLEASMRGSRCVEKRWW